MLDLMCIECGAVRPGLRLRMRRQGPHPLEPVRSISILAGFFQQLQLVDSSVEATRVFWRTRAGASEEEALDPRPFSDVLFERQDV